MYTPPGYEAKKPDSPMKEILQILGVLVLLLVLLFFITKYNYVSCNDLPGWCPIYCSVAGRDRIAVVYSINGTGDYDALYSKLTGQSVPNEYLQLYNQIYRDKALSLDRFDLKESSEVLLSKYNLLIFTKAQDVSPSELNDIKTFVLKGGKVIITGNSLTKVGLGQRDIDALLSKNKTIPGSYEKTMKSSSTLQPFGDLGTLGSFSYIGESKVGADFIIADDTFKPLKGFQNKISGITNYSRVNYGSGVRVPAFMTKGDDKDPAIIESKVGSANMIYVAFPLEDFPSPLLALNLIDYYTPCSFK